MQAAQVPLVSQAIRPAERATRQLPGATKTSDAGDMETNATRPIRLLLLDDHDVARRQSVARLGRHPHLAIVGDMADDSVAATLAQQLEADAVLVETRRLDKRGLQSIKSLSSLKTRTRPAIVAYVEILHRDDWAHARAAGADDVLLKEMSPEAIAKELQIVVDRVHNARSQSGSSPITDWRPDGRPR